MTNPAVEAGDPKHTERGFNSQTRNLTRVRSHSTGSETTGKFPDKMLAE
jgi:hypothetical protein